MSILYHSIPLKDAAPPRPDDPPVSVPPGLDIHWASMDHRWIPTDRHGHVFRVPYADAAPRWSDGEILGFTTREEAAAFCRAWVARRSGFQASLWADNAPDGVIPPGTWLEQKETA